MRHGGPWSVFMVKLPIHWIEAQTHCHATEEEARVERSLAFVCPEAETTREVFEGHFGNTLVRLSRRIEDGKAIRATWGRWSTWDLPKILGKDLDARIDDEGILHFRLDKQAAFGGEIRLAQDSDVIDVRLKLMAFPAKVEEARRVARSILSEAL